MSMFSSKKPDGDGAKTISPLNSLRPALPATASPAPRPVTTAGHGNSNTSVIGADLFITGNLQSAGEVQIDGTINGDLTASRIVVGQNAKITGSLIADDIVVQGSVQGSLRGNRVTLQSSSKVEGDILHQSLAIEQGAFFEGKSRRAENPIDAKPASNGAAGEPVLAPAMN